MLLCSNALFVVLSNYRHFFLPQSSSASRFNRWGLWVLALDPIPRASRAIGRAKLHGCDAFQAKLQAWGKAVGPSPSICSLNRMPGPALATIDASVALRTPRWCLRPLHTR